MLRLERSRIPFRVIQLLLVEEVVGGEEWQISLGRANAVFFEQLFGYIFESVIVLGPDDDPNVMISLVLDGLFLFD